MQQYQGGEIVLTTFPFADRAGAKLRPSLVLRDVGDDNVILAQISSRTILPAFDVALTDWRQAGLVYPSVVCVDKLQTTAKTRVQGYLGTITPRDWAQVPTRVRRLWAKI